MRKNRKPFGLVTLILILVMLAAMSVSVAADGYYEYGDVDTAITVKKSDSVIIDGVISEGEYYEYTNGYTEWYISLNAVDFFNEAERMAKTAKWYFSWDGDKYLNVAVKWNADPGFIQTCPGGDYFGDYDLEGTAGYVDSRAFLGCGPGVNVVSAEKSTYDADFPRFNVSFGENTVTGEKITGLYIGQNGQNMDYFPEAQDFEFSTEGSWVTAELRIPISELSETFKPGKNDEFEASITLHAGIGSIEYDNPETYSWGVRLGQYGYNEDTVNLNKKHAKFKLEGSDTYSGACGDNLTWNFDSISSTLTVSGTGDMWDFSSPKNTPWAMYKDITEKVVVESGVTSIGKNAFSYFNSLETVEISDGVTKIGDTSFTSDKNLTSITIPNSVRSIGDLAFFLCNNLTSITFNGTKSEWDDISVGQDNDNLLYADKIFNVGNGKSGQCGDNLTWSFDDKQWLLLILGDGEMWDYKTETDAPWHNLNVRAVRIENGVTSIGQFAFSGLYNLADVTLPKSVTAVGAYSFKNCINLTSVIMLGNVTSIGEYAFYDCYRLAYTNIPSSVITLGEGAFLDCDLESIVIPAGVLEIGEGVFKYNDDLKTAGPIGSGNDIQFGWTEKIPAGAFSECTSLESVVIPEGIESVGEGAFYQCESLTSVALPESLKEIYSGGFECCWSLPAIEIPEGVTAVGEYAFFECTSLAEINLPVSLKNIEYGTFGYCGSIDTVYYNGTKAEWDSMTVGGNNDMLLQANMVFGGQETVHSHDYSGNICSGCGIPCGKCGDNVTWILENGTLTISGSGDMWDYSTENKAMWYADHGDVIRILVVEDGVTSLGDYAFAYLSSLIDITLPEGLTSTGEGTFFGCSWFSSIILPESLTVIEPYAFAYCTGLYGITLPKGVTTVGSHAFADCSMLDIVTIPVSVKTIEDGAFSGANNIYKVFYEGSKSQWNEISVGSDNDDLLNAEIFFDGETHRHDYGSLSCKVCGIPCGMSGPYSKWILKNGTLTISGTGDMWDYSINGGQPWYEHRLDVVSLVIEDGVTNIGSYAFNDCYNLISVALPDSLLTVKECAFQYCASIESITLPKNVTTIGNNVFTGCSNIEKIIVDPENPVYSSDVYGVLFNKDKTEIIMVPEKLSGEYIIPDSVVRINSGAFSGCEYLESVTIPEGVTVIEDRVFEFCQRLAYVTLKGNVTRIGTSVFSQCYCLEEINIPDTLESIGYGAFRRCHSLASISLPESLKLIEDSAFSECPRLTTVYYGGSESSWKKINFSAHNDTLLNAEIIFAKESHKHDYSGAVCTECGTPCGKCGDNLTWEFDSADGTLYIGGTGYMQNYEYSATEVPWYDLRFDIKNVVISVGVQSIGDAAFAYCENLSSVTFADGVERIGNYAFSDCYSLMEIDLPYSLTSIGDFAFQCCTGIDHIDLNARVTDIGENPFWGCTALRYVFSGGTYTDYVDVDGILFTLDMTTLVVYPAGRWESQYTVPGGVTRIAKLAFNGCLNLESITLPASLTNIDEGAFNICEKLTSVIYDGTKADWDKIVVEDFNDSLFIGDFVYAKHSHDYKADVTAPDCINKGYTTYTCDCGDSYTDEETAALGHDFADEWTVDVPATEDSEGQKSRHCSRCDEVTDVIVIAKPLPMVDSAEKFTDVVVTSWSKAGIDYVVSYGYMNGTGNGSTFSPSGTMTRAMIVSVLHRMAGKPAAAITNPFSDLEAGQTWYHEAVIWAAGEGIVTGTSATTFGPTGAVTREQMATFLYRFAKYMELDVTATADLSAFPDEANVGSWAKEALSWANANGLITGAKGADGVTRLAPQGEATREQVATILMRFCQKFGVN